MKPSNKTYLKETGLLCAGVVGLYALQLYTPIKIVDQNVLVGLMAVIVGAVGAILRARIKGIIKELGGSDE